MKKEYEMIDIENLTLAQIKQIAAMSGRITRRYSEYFKTQTAFKLAMKSNVSEKKRSRIHRRLLSQMKTLGASHD